MLRASQFRVASVQVALFTPDRGAFSPPLLIGNLLMQHPDLFDGPIASFPWPDDAPPEVPRAVLQSNDGMWRLTAAPARIDLLWVGRVTDPEPVGIVSRCSEILAEYASSNQVRVNRLALILVRACAVDNPAQELIGRFCNIEASGGPFRHSSNFEIHNHKRYELQDFGRVVNSWVRCKTGSLLQRPAVVVEQDLNTVEEEAHQPSFDRDDIAAYFAQAEIEAASILRLYFPEEG